MQLIIYPKLCADSQRAMLKTRNGSSRRYNQLRAYKPNQILIRRLQNETGMTQSTILKQIQKERKYMLSY